MNESSLPLAGFTVDVRGEQLRDAQGRSVELRPQAWAVLRHLATKPGQLVTKNELLDAVWPGLVVTDGSIAQAISDVRVALKDAEHRVVRTVPRRGYMLVADTVASSESAAAVEPGRRPRSNVPIAGEPLIGREADIAALAEWLAEHRLVTIIGPGGIGKTRLAQVVARERQGAHAHGVWWIDLAALSAAEQIAPAIAMAAELQLAAGDPAAALARSLADRDVLLVLDNCEHLVAAIAGVVQAIVSSAPAVHLLATSQETLRVPGEQLYRLDTLSVPPPDASLAEARRHSALRLLERRACDVDRRFELRDDTLPAAIELCRQLDGIPLAIEMAAARLPTLGIEAVRRLVAEKLLRNAMRGAPARQQTLRATLEWSHALLDAQEQAVLRQLSVFAGSFELDTAQGVVAVEGSAEPAVLDAIHALVGKSLLQVQPGDAPRYRLLETMRLFAAEQLAAVGETDAAIERHVRAMTGRAEAMERDYWVLADAPWLARHRADFDDLQAACDVALMRRDAAAVAPLMLALRRFDYLRGMVVTVASRAASAAAVLPSAAPRARAVLWDTLMAAGSTGQAPLAAAQEAVAAWRQLGDTAWLYRSLCAYAVACAGAEDCRRANRALREALALERPDWAPRLRLFGAASAAAVSGHCEPVGTWRKRCFGALALAQSAGASREALCMRLELAHAAMLAGDLHEAIASGQAIVAETGASGHSTSLCVALTVLCAAWSRQGDLPAARLAAAQALPLALRDGHPAALFDHIALLAARMEDARLAARMLGCADAWYAGVRGMRGPAEASSADLAAQSIKAALGTAECGRLRAEGARLSVAQGGELAQEWLGAAARRD